jgi:hypothetical protein
MISWYGSWRVLCYCDGRRTPLAELTRTLYPESHDSVKQSMLQFLVSNCEEILTLYHLGIEC